ncbi:hypothetical protein SS50377_25091 [Spironucleus salmonicida]|uniref:Uncharacterized protein n=1 Tax=Spironucleus salmonicida TaxID=348837 RepID=V6LGX6_9EUKA|nr:hypothetical protein SS50377_25091 [Spironucleus salmonicida]|eukprot:EST42961.1 Hypothetical protein SS50377_17410 [Spironucleus salmonicida]
MNTERLSLTKLHATPSMQTYNRQLASSDASMPFNAIGTQLVPQVGTIVTTRSGKVAFSAMQDNADIPACLVQKVRSLYAEKPVTVRPQKVEISGNAMRGLVGRKCCEDTDCRNWERKV